MVLLCVRSRTVISLKNGQKRMNEFHPCLNTMSLIHTYLSLQYISGGTWLKHCYRQQQDLHDHGAVGVCILLLCNMHHAGHPKS
jgi:hypothetical protein